MGKAFRRLEHSVASEGKRHHRASRGVHTTVMALGAYALELGHWVLQHSGEDVDTSDLVAAHRDFEEALKEYMR